MSDKKKKKIPWQQYLVMVGFMLIGAVCGILMVEYMDSHLASDSSLAEEIGSMAVLFLGMYLAMLLQIIIHEAGHLVFGLLTGYQFSSFRIGSFMWIIENKKLKFKRFSLAGTGGQCLMAPPDLKDGKIPVVLYNLGGSLLNLIAALICVGLYFLCAGISILPPFFLMMALIGVAFALMNGIPLHMGPVDNDGFNALSLGKDPAALRAFWIQMKINEQLTKGIRLKDMPEEWFAVPSEESMKNSMLAAPGVFACNRLMDEQHLEEANVLMKRLLGIKSGMVGVHKNLLICDRIYCELVSHGDCEAASELMDKKQKQFMKTMKKYPSVIRTEYVYALLVKKDETRAQRIKEIFEKTARNYPYPSDMDSERELMEKAQEMKWGHQE